MEEPRIEDLLLPENTTTLSLEEVNQLAHGDLLEQALSTFLLTDQAEPFFTTVVQFLGISRLAPLVQEYMKAAKHVQSIKGPFQLDGLAANLRARGTWERWMTNRWGEGWFPGIYIGYERLGTEFLLLLESGRIISLHHDATLSEVASEIEQGADSREQFLEALITEGSGWTLTQLMQLQTGLWKLGINNKEIDERTFEQVRALVCSLQNWSAEELEEALMEPKMEFLGYYCGR